MEFVPQPVSLEADQRTKRRRRGLIALLLSLSLLTLGTGVFSLAVFTSTDSSTGSFSTGTIVLGVSPDPVFSATGILPGDAGSATLTVTNSGSGALRYAMTSTAPTPTAWAARSSWPSVRRRLPRALRRPSTTVT